MVSTISGAMFASQLLRLRAITYKSIEALCINTYINPYIYTVAKTSFVFHIFFFFLIVFIDLQTCITNVININNNYN